jgi:membrane protein YqaA with SNARE-associated domain
LKSPDTRHHEDTPSPARSVASPNAGEWLSYLARNEYLKWAGWLVLAVGITIPIVLLRDEISRFSQYGYPGLFVLTFLGSAALFLGAPVFAMAMAAGAALNPILVGLIAGLGSALGELTGYLAGFGGHSLLRQKPFYQTMEGWMHRRGVLVIFLLGLIPNPLFDVGGVIAGASRLPMWQFVLAGWAGKALRLMALAFAGHFLLGGELRLWVDRSL